MINYRKAILYWMISIRTTEENTFVEKVSANNVSQVLKTQFHKIDYLKSSQALLPNSSTFFYEVRDFIAVY